MEKAIMITYGVLSTAAVVALLLLGRILNIK